MIGPAPITYAYEWRHCDLSGANGTPVGTGQQYIFTTDDIGSTFRVVETATNAAGSGAVISDRSLAVTAP